MDNKLLVFRINVSWGEYVGGIVVEKDTGEEDAFSLLQGECGNIYHDIVGYHKSHEIIFVCDTNMIFGATFFGGSAE